MTLLAIAGVALVAEAVAAWRGSVRNVRLVSLGVYAGLAASILAVAGQRAFGGGEPGLLGWFAYGLLILFVGAAFSLDSGFGRWSLVATPIAGALFALGFDFAQPDEYAYVPGAILAGMVLIVVVTAHARLATLNGKNPSLQDRVGLALKALALGLLVFAAIFKVIDRGWQLPWSYIAAGGGLLFAAAQLRLGVQKLRRGKPMPGWLLAADVGVAGMTAAALVVYSTFL